MGGQHLGGDMGIVPEERLAGGEGGRPPLQAGDQAQVERALIQVGTYIFFHLIPIGLMVKCRANFGAYVQQTTPDNWLL